MKKSALSCAITATLLGVSQAYAGGLWINDFGDFAGGRASAGASAGVDEASTIAHNPASATRIEGSQLFLSGTVFVPDIKFDVKYSGPITGYDNGGDAGELTPAPSMAYVHDMGDSNWSTGIYLGGLAGAGMKYGSHWAGRYNATEVDLSMLVVAPTLAYQFDDRLSIGVALQGWYSTFEQKLALPNPEHGGDDARAKLDGDDSGVAFTLGAMYELTERTRFGIHYQSEIEPEYDGDLKIHPVNLEANTNTELTFAQYVRASMHHDMDEQWSVNLTLGWDNWSALDNVLISSDRGNAGLPTRWRDTYHYAWGVQYKLNSKWELTSGVAYDTNPVDARYRTPELPLDRQLRYAAGARYQFSDTLTLGGYANYADLGKGRIDAKHFGGEYQQNAALQIAFNLNWTF